MDNKVIKIVRNYILEHLDKSDPTPEFEVYIVWKSKVLQNWKYLLSSTLNDRGVHEVKSYKDVINQFKKEKYIGEAYDIYQYNPDGMDKGLTDKEYLNKATQNLIYTSTRR